MVLNSLQSVFAVVAAVLIVTAPVAGVGSTTGVAASVDGGPDSDGEPAKTLQEDVDASILFFNHESGSFEPGDEIKGEIEVRNTGDSRETFFVGYSVVGPNGEYYDNNGETGRTVTLDPGERKWVSVSWTVESDAPTGDYDAVASVWAESDRDNLNTRLANKEKSNVFEVVEPPEVDAQITDFAVAEGEFQPGDEVDARVTVENTGETTHTFFVGFGAIGPDGENYNNDGQTGRTVTLSPGEEETVPLSWVVEESVPKGIYGAGTAVWEESDRDNLNTRLAAVERDSAFRVIEPTDIDGEIVDWDVESGEFTPGDSVDADVIVENTGNTEHTFFIGYSVIGPNGNYYSNDKQTGVRVTLDPGERTSVSLSWDVGSTVPTGAYDVRVSMWEEADRDNLHTRLDDGRRYDVFEVTDPTSVDAQIEDWTIDGGEKRPGEDVESSILVENTGNTEHTYFVGYSAIGPDGEYYDNDRSTGTQVTLEPGEQRVVDVSWEVPTDASEGDYDIRASVWKESDRDNLQTRLDNRRSSNAVTVIEETEISAEILDEAIEEGSFKTGDTVNAYVRVRNTGNSEHTFFVGYSTIGPNGDQYDNNGQTGTQVTLDPGEEQTVELEWTVESRAPAGEYDAQLSIWQESDRDRLQTSLDRVREHDIFEVQPAIDISAEVLDLEIDRGEHAPGDEVTTTAIVENTGNSEHTFYVRYRPINADGSIAAVGSNGVQAVTLAPGERRSISLDWVISEDAASGEYDVGVAIWNSSDFDERLTASVESDVVTVIQSQEGAIQNIFAPSSYEVGDTATFEIRVSNPTGVQQSYTLSTTVDGDIDSFDAPTQEITLDAGETRTVDVPVTVTSDVTARTLPFEFVLRSEDGTSVDSASESIQRETTELVVYTIDTEGNPISGITVDPYFPDLEQRTSDENGTVVYSDISPGAALVFLENTQDSGWVATKSNPSYEVTIEEGERARVVAEFEKTVTVSGAVEGENGDPISDVRVSIASENANVDVGPDGEFTFRGLEPGISYTFEVWRGADKLASVTRSFDAGSQSLPLVVSNEELDSPAGVRDRLSHAIDNLFGDSTSNRKELIFGNNTVVVDDDDEPSYQTEAGINYFLTEDGTSYRTSGPCAWYNSREQCQSYRTTTSTGLASNQGMVDGFSAGLGETISGVKQLTEPVKYAQSIIELVLTVLGDISVLGDLIAQLPEQVQEQQQDDNPFSQQFENEQYEAYQASWYAGYISYYVFASSFGGSASNYVKNSERLSDAADRLGDVSRERISRAVQFEARLRTDGPKSARYYVEVPSGVDASQWRQKIGKFVDDPDVPDSLVVRYERAVKAAYGNDKIEGADELYQAIIKQNEDKLAGTVLEADRAVRLANKKSTERVVVEPNDLDGGNQGTYDLQIDKQNGDREYIEVKNVNPKTGAMTAQNLRDKVVKIQNQLGKSSFASDGTSVATIGARSISDGLDSREAMFGEIRQAIAKTDSRPEFDELRIVEGAGKNQRVVYTFDADEFVIENPDYSDATIRDRNADADQQVAPQGQPVASVDGRPIAAI